MSMLMITLVTIVPASAALLVLLMWSTARGQNWLTHESMRHVNERLVEEGYVASVTELKAAMSKPEKAAPKKAA
jgi:hypothetical protein